MNKEIERAINEQQKRHPIKEWWYKNYYKVFRVILFPIWIGCIIHDKTNEYLNNKTVWSEKRANEILSYYIPRRANWSAKDETFYFFDNGWGWCFSSAKRFLKRKDYRFWKKYTCGRGGKIKDYLIDKFELEGFYKVEYENYDGNTDLGFVKI